MNRAFFDLSRYRAERDDFFAMDFSKKKKTNFFVSFLSPEQFLQDFYRKRTPSVLIFTRSKSRYDNFIPFKKICPHLLEKL